MSFPVWYIPLLVYFIGSTTNGVLQRKMAVTSKVPPRLITAILYLGFLMPVGIVIAFLQGGFWIDLQPITVVLLLIQAIGISTFFAFAFQLNRHVDATQYAVIANMYTLVTVALGVFIIHEPFTMSQFIGMILLLTGGILVTIKGLRREAWRLDTYTLRLGAVAVGIGIGLAAERGCLNYMSSSVYMILGWGLQTIVLCLFAHRDWPAVRHITKTDWHDIIRLGFVRASYNTGFFLSVALSRNVSLIATITSFRLPMVFVASYIVLNEREHVARRFVGVGVATAGLLLL